MVLQEKPACYELSLLYLEIGKKSQFEEKIDKNFFCTLPVLIQVKVAVSFVATGNVVELVMVLLNSVGNSVHSSTTGRH